MSEQSERVPGPGESAALARGVVPALVSVGASERPITVDQTNVSVVVGDTVVVKWLRDPRPAPHRGARLLAHLAAVGFTEMPPFHGTADVDGRVVAIVTGYVAGSRDGWEWYVADVIDALDIEDPAPPIATAARLGAIAARLHLALASASDVIAEPVRTGRLDDEVARGRRLLADARRLTTGTARAGLEQVVDGVGGDLNSLAQVPAVVLQPVHGDLHVGQMLRAGDDIVVTDFDGDPVSVIPDGDADVHGDGIERRSPMVDLAALVQSVDHVARVVARRRPDLAVPLDHFVVDATNAVVDAYAAAAPLEERVLRPLRVIQELHEFVYAATVLPRWSYAPEAALAALYR